jgi:hypothetical protein
MRFMNVRRVFQVMCRIGLLAIVLLLAPLPGIRWAVALTMLSASVQCPSITVKCPASLVKQGEPLTFTAAINGGTPNAQYTFNWMVSAGTISSGQGTPTITLDTTGLGGQNIQVTVEVGGIPEKCVKSESCGASVYPPPLAPHSFDQYSNLNFSDETARLDNFAIQLQVEPEFVGYIVTHANKRVSPNEARNRARRAKQYVVNRRGIKAKRVVAVYGGRSDFYSTVLWIFPSDFEIRLGRTIK